MITSPYIAPRPQVNSSASIHSARNFRLLSLLPRISSVHQHVCRASTKQDEIKYQLNNIVFLRFRAGKGITGKFPYNKQE